MGSNWSQFCGRRHRCPDFCQSVVHCLKEVKGSREAGSREAGSREVGRMEAGSREAGRREAGRMEQGREGRR